MGKKIYVVKKGKEPGIYDTWKECQAQVSGYSGAIFKKVNSREEAKEFLNNNSKKKLSDNNKKLQKNKSEDTDLYHWSLIQSFKKNTIVAYTDGSNRVLEPNNLYSGAAIIIDNGKIVKRLYDYGQKPGLAKMRNVAGELVGATLAITYAKSNENIGKVIVIHDYLGISEWANKTWKRKNEYTQKYAKYVADCRKKIDIEFKHVKGHSGNIYNNEADALCGYIAEMVKEKQDFSLEDFIQNHSVIGVDKSLGKLVENFMVKFEEFMISGKLYLNDEEYTCLIGKNYKRVFKKEKFNLNHFNNFVKKFSDDEAYREKWNISS